MSTPSPKTWFITGASSGFGMAFAEFALERGDHVVATARSVSKLEALVARGLARLRALGFTAHGLHAGENSRSH